MKKFLILLCLPFVMMACNNDNEEIINSGINEEVADNETNNVLLLTVDYMSNAFEGGVEFNFTEASDDFDLILEYVLPGDFGSIKLIYDNIDEVLFDGTIHWMGLGERTFPETLQPADSFQGTLVLNYVYPQNGIEDIFNPMEETFDYERVWGAIQYLIKVREYVEHNPEAQVKLFLYTPSVGVGNPYDWYWVIFMKR